MSRQTPRLSSAVNYNATARNRIARLNSNGSLDTSFNPGTGANNGVRAIAIQSGGRIIIGGDFSIYNGVDRNHIARLNTDGSMDTTFDPGTGANNTVWATAPQPDAKILIGGDFTTYNGVTRNRIARLELGNRATWNLTPGSGDWNTGTNWTPAVVPNGPEDTASFSLSNVTNASISANTEVNGIVYNSGASAFTITAGPQAGYALTISGMGITNNSGIIQNVVAAAEAGARGWIRFTKSATAGSLTTFTNNGSTYGNPSGVIQFLDTSSAGNATFVNIGGTSGGGGGNMFFNNTATATNGIFTNNGGGDGGSVGGIIYFYDSSTAGHGIFTNNAGGYVAGRIQFYGTSSAGNGNFTNGNATYIDFFDSATAADGTFTNNGDSFCGSVSFHGTSTAGDGIFTNNPATVSGGQSGFVAFWDTSTAANGTITNNGGTVAGAPYGSFTDFINTSTAGNATLIANGGQGGGLGGVIYFENTTTGGTARVEVFDNGNLDISLRSAPGVTTSSIEGSGLVFLGANKLTVGSNNLSTTFSGIIQDGGYNGGTGGSLTKIGTGTLTLSKRSTYTGATTISAGTLLVKNTGGSATGTGAVQVKAGTLSGTGKISGTVAVGTGTGAGAFLSPGLSGTVPGAITIQKKLTFNADATYQCGLNSSTVTADNIVAKGVAINSAALFSFTDLGAGTLTVGTVFTIINNTAATPITGTFSNLADGSTFTVGSNTFKANYEGGTANDLTLTVQ